MKVRDLAEEVGTSIIPVRDAIRSLVECGLAEQEPYKSALVRGFDPEELQHAYDARGLLEGECARLAAPRADDALVRQLEEAWVEVCDAHAGGDVQEILELEERLLDLVYQRSGNPVLCDLVHTLWEKYRPYKVLWISSVLDGREGIGWVHGGPLVEAMRNRDPDAAASAMAAQYADARTVVHQLLEQQKRLPEGQL